MVAKKERPEESESADESSFPEAVVSDIAESTARKSSSAGVLHDAAPVVHVKQEPQIEEEALKNASGNAEVQPDKCSHGNEATYRGIIQENECASNSLPVAQLMVRVKPEPRDTMEPNNQSNTREDNSDNTPQNAAATIETSASINPNQATDAITTELVASAPHMQETEEPYESTAVSSSTDDLLENEADAEPTSAQPCMELSITAALTAATVKPEPEPDSCMPETIPDGFFDDLLDNADQLTAELSPPTVDEAEPEQYSSPAARAANVSETTQSVENNSVDENLRNQALPNESLRIKNEPLSSVERNDVPVGDEQDNILTPRASPQRSGVEEETLSYTTARAQVRVKNEVGQEVESGCNEEAIPDNFFDDLLRDRVAERVARMEGEVQEIKYAERLKELKEQLRRLEENGQDSNDAHEKSNSSGGHKHKSKKSKKKSRKRARSRERRKESEDKVESTVNVADSSSSKRRRSRSISREPDMFGSETPQFNTNYGNLPKVPPPPAYSQIASTSTAHAKAEPNNFIPFPMPIMVKSEPSADLAPIPFFANEDEYEDMELDCLPVQSSSNITTAKAAEQFSGFKKIKLERPAAEPAKPLILTPAMKKQKALQLAAETIQQFQGAKNNQSSFFFASTVRKLPTSSSFVTKQSYEHRSPLHTIHNVRYTFNSHSTRFNLREWGIEALPKIAAKVARIVGCDAGTLFVKLQTANLSTKYNKIKRDPDDNGESVEVTKSSFFTNAMTQTDDVYVLTSRRCNANDVGVQVTPTSGHVGTQTTPSSSMTSTNNDLPLMQLINVLNENQLLALNDFAELLREPAGTAIDIYHLRTRMLDIYKFSQQPSVMPEATITASVRTYQETPRRLPLAMPEAPITAYREVPRRLPEAPINASARTYQEASRRLPNSPDYRQQLQWMAAGDPRAATSSGTPNFAAQTHFRSDPRLNPAAIQQQRAVQFQGLPTQHRELQTPPGSAPTKNYGRGSVRR